MATAEQRRRHTARKIDLALTNGQLENESGTRLLTTGEFLSGGVAAAPWHEFARCLDEVAPETVARWDELGTLGYYLELRAAKGREPHRCEFRTLADLEATGSTDPTDEEDADPSSSSDEPTGGGPAPIAIPGWVWLLGLLGAVVASRRS